MFVLFFCFGFLIILSLVLFFLPLILKTNLPSYSKTGCLEAGFFTTGQIQLSFSIQFIFLLLIFILFDTEVLFTFGFVLNFYNNIKLNFFILGFLFITLVFEWKWNKLIWVSLLSIEKIE